jgi:hypothetical protein
MAAVDISGSVAVGGQYDTNARQLGGTELPPPTADSIARDDVATFVTAGVNAALGATGPLSANLSASYTHSESMRQDELSHDDYTFSAGMAWTPSQAFNLALLATQDRLPLGLADVGGNQSTPQTSQRYQATVRVRPTPRWQLSLTPGWSETRTPLQDAEDFRVIETSAGASMEFIGAGRLVPGISASRGKSRYSGIEDATRYTQETVQGTLSYRLTEVTAFSLSAGKSWRTTQLRAPTNDPAAIGNEGRESSFTGSLSTFRQLTPKTSVNLNVFRNFQYFDAGVNLSVGTGFSAGVNWAATPKTSAALSVSHSWSNIDNFEINGVAITRKDLLRSYTLGISYLATRSVSLSTNVTRQVRNSRILAEQYNSTIAGVSLSVRFD